MCRHNDPTVVINRLASIAELTDTIYQFAPTRQHKQILVLDGSTHTDYFCLLVFTCTKNCAEVRVWWTHRRRDVA